MRRRRTEVPTTGLHRPGEGVQLVRVVLHDAGVAVHHELTSVFELAVAASPQDGDNFVGGPEEGVCNWLPDCQRSFVAKLVHEVNHSAAIAIDAWDDVIDLGDAGIDEEATTACYAR